MKCQILFVRKNKKIISKCCLLKFLPSMQSKVLRTSFIAPDKRGVGYPHIFGLIVYTIAPWYTNAKISLR